MNRNKLKWTPLLSLGPIKFDTPFVINSFGDLRIEDDSDPDMDWKTYRIIELRTTVHVEDGVITNCETSLSCVYGQKELIGMTLDELYEIFPDDLEFRESFDGFPYTNDEYICDKMDITFWLEDGIVASITVGGSVYED